MDKKALEETTRIFSNGLELIKEIEDNKFEIETLRLKAANYKALYHNKHEISKKIYKQIIENEYNIFGESKEVPYSSKFSNSIFRTLEDMFNQRIIDAEEYYFCKNI